MDDNEKKFKEYIKEYDNHIEALSGLKIGYVFITIIIAASFFFLGYSVVGGIKGGFCLLIAFFFLVFPVCLGAFVGVSITKNSYEEVRKEEIEKEEERKHVHDDFINQPVITDKQEIKRILEEIRNNKNNHI